MVLDADDLTAVRATVLHALQLGRLTKYLQTPIRLMSAVAIPHSKIVRGEAIVSRSVV